MNHVFIISNDSCLQISIERYLRFNLDIKSEPISIPLGEFTSERIVTAFRQVANIIESMSDNESSPQSLCHAIVIIDLCDDNLSELKQLNLVTKKIGWSAVVAMLVLAFPEIHWIFITPYRSLNSSFLQFHHLSAENSISKILGLQQKKISTLFDPTNLRNLLRQNIKNSLTDQTTQYLPLRQSLAAAIDEEEAYTFFNAYTAYRFGFRTHVVLSHAMMQDLFGNKKCRFLDEIPLLLFEDIYLNFPDQDSGMHYSALCERDREYSRLQAATYRIFVTVGHRANEQAWQRNIEHLCNLRSMGKFCKMLFKPIAGIFDIWKKSGLQYWLRSNKGLAPGFFWPPNAKNSTESETRGHHSAPGRLLEIADRLIQRAERILNSAISVPEAIHGALLALEAQELLGNKTPTTALEALSLKHQLEVSAECMFYGVEYNFDVKSRFQDIETEVRSIGSWFYSRTRRLSELNAEISILSDLMQRFRQYNQFDEEQECLQRIRQLHRHLWFRKNKSWAWLFYPIRAYIEYLLGRLHRFVIAIVFWFLSLSFLFDACIKNKHSNFFINMLRGPAHAITSFFGMQPAYDMVALENMGTYLELLTLVTIVLGFIHLGIFISHVYSIVSRR